MRRQRRAIFKRLILPALSLVFIGSPGFSAEGKSRGELPSTILFQKCLAFGKVQTSVTANAVRVEVIGRDLILIAKAPTWKVGFYNVKTKKALEMSFDRYVEHQIAYSYLVDSSSEERFDKNKFKDVAQWWQNRSVPQGKVNYAGMNCLAYRFRSAGDARSITYVMEKTPLDIKGQIVLEKFFGCQTGVGVPVFHEKVKNPSAQYGTAPGLTNMFTASGSLRTTNVERKSLPSNLFEYYQGFVSVHKEIELIGYEADGEPEILDSKKSKN